jgi:hypothetical protein
VTERASVKGKPALSSGRNALRLAVCLSGYLTASCSPQQPKPTIGDEIATIEKQCGVPAGSVRLASDGKVTNVILPCATDEENNCLTTAITPLAGRNAKFSLSCYREVG